MRPFMKISNPPNPFLPPKHTATISCSPVVERVLANVAILSFDCEATCLWSWSNMTSLPIADLSVEGIHFGLTMS